MYLNLQHCFGKTTPETPEMHETKVFLLVPPHATSSRRNYFHTKQSPFASYTETSHNLLSQKKPPAPPLFLVQNLSRFHNPGKQRSPSSSPFCVNNPHLEEVASSYLHRKRACIAQRKSMRARARARAHSQKSQQTKETRSQKKFTNPERSTSQLTSASQ